MSTTDENADVVAEVEDVTEEVAPTTMVFEHLEPVEEWQEEEQQAHEQDAGGDEEQQVQITTEQEVGEVDGEVKFNVRNLSSIEGTSTVVIVEHTPEHTEHPGTSQAITVSASEFVCTVCRVELTSKQALGAHMRKAHNQELPTRRNHICTYCSKAFTTASNLQQHKRLHFNDRPFQCNQCNKGFATSTNLKQHYRTHTGDRPFQCTYCHKRFATNSNLRQHIRTHTADIIADSAIQATMRTNPDGIEAWEEGEAGTNISMIPAICLHQYSCDICQKVYSNSSNLAQHKRTIHPRDFVRRYLCEYCQKTFSLITNLRRHQKRTCPNAQKAAEASDAFRQSWPCEECGKVCSTKGNLKSHKFTHLGIKQFECLICEKKFTTHSNLKQHMIVHDGKYNATIQPRRKKGIDPKRPDSSETSTAVRNLQIVSETLTPNQEEYVIVQETVVQPPLAAGRTQRPLIVKVDIDRDVKPVLNSPKPVLLPPTRRV